MADVKWLINRLKTMSPGEIQFRTSQFVKKKIEKKRLTVPKSTLIRAADLSSFKTFDFDDFELPETSKFHFFGLEIDLDKPILFHHDISSGKDFPMSFSKDINIRSDAFGSAKVVWEVNRLQFLLPILIKYRQTGDKSFLDQFVRIMSEWNEQNPYLKGVNWYSNIEVNIRLINWYWCWLLLADDKKWTASADYKKFTDEIWLPLIYQHCFYAYNNPSYYSSANNHLISEYAGLFIANCLWKFEESDKWMQFAIKGLEKEILVQHSANGVNKEEAAEYIQFITDFFLISYVVGEQHGIKFSASYGNMLSKICDYIYHFLDAKGNFPKYGDEDDGRVILPDFDTHSNNFTSILNTAAVLFQKPEWKRPDSEWDIKSELLTAYRNGKAYWNKITPSDIPLESMFYAEEGHFYFKGATDTGKEIYAHLDAAPLGFLSIAAHGHADSLSYFINLDGFPFLVDPGTFTYHTHPEVRKYFVSTLAHNTIAVGDEDQAKLAGPTMWLQHFKSNVESFNKEGDTEKVVASHNGYLKNGVLHRRSFEFHKKQSEFRISDDIIMEGTKETEIRMPFHVHQSVQIQQIDPVNFILSRPGDTELRIHIELSSLLNYEICNAKEENPLGWYSPTFMVKVPSSLVLGSVKLSKSISLETKIKILSTL